jgi:signal transduction histidine kinase
MPARKRLRKAQEHTTTRAEAAKTSFIWGRILAEVAAPLAETASLGQHLLESTGGKLSCEQRLAEALVERPPRLAQRLRDYVDLMLLEAGDLPLQLEVHDLGRPIEEAVRQLRPAARAKGLGLAVERAEQPLPPVLADPARVTQVLVHLLGNAIRFTDRGQITVSTEPYDRSVAVHIVDTGAGIPADQIARLFEDCFPGDTSARAQEPQGCAGLGLTLSRRLVVRSGGDLWASSRIGAGSKLSFTVPRAPGAATTSHLAPV